MKTFAWEYKNHPRTKTLIPSHHKNLHEWYFLCEAHADELRDLMNSGQAYEMNDWSGGWSWTATVLKTKSGKVFRLFGNGTVCPYGGQHDKPVYYL